MKPVVIALGELSWILSELRIENIIVKTVNRINSRGKEENGKVRGADKLKCDNKHV